LRCESLQFFTSAHLDQKGGDYSPPQTYTCMGIRCTVVVVFHWLYIF